VNSNEWIMTNAGARAARARRHRLNITDHKFQNKHIESIIRPRPRVIGASHRTTEPAPEKLREAPALRCIPGEGAALREGAVRCSSTRVQR
jgi:hypothetical protein